ncbi:anaerobic carbon-monoxide dehydrogenase catalytic subunit [Desulfocurvibacter africanus]|uniref:Carbon monoxide dehydrogenase n=1 Tax=Desulfocurvibacter africanus subsp. africanus str. Walvis Bay TaxID=690850 RepID=F3Z1M0_DESAF|nr:anaerobic carbon-monoxide dehydrogenase catalytic subunit [Desulfocurvibacter africanus]EGJ51155.1 carbon-monoxide dehydrogenase, catalytic subunit [Desulfocurvibacter africanus subsp. africanus str. Walvis Bay]
MTKEQQGLENLSIWNDAASMLAKAKKDGVETVWDRLHEQRNECAFCAQGLSCSKCVMGPCRINMKGDKRQHGVCGADADLTVARNFGRFVAAGAASHSDHGRDVLDTFAAVAEGKTKDFQIRDEAKLRRIASELGLASDGQPIDAIARALADKFYQDYSSRSEELSFLSRVPEKRRTRWAELGVTPRGIDREVVEMMHRTHMGVDCDATNICLHAVRTALADGWGGSMIATELSDILFGTPRPTASKVNLGVLRKDMVNVLVHGHSPVVSETILAAAKDQDILAEAAKAGASGINIAGLCCTGNEVLMRQGIPLAGNHLMTELALITGAVELMVVDYQCIMPSLVRIAACYHTRFVSTQDKAKFPGATHVPFTPENARDKAREVLRMAIEAYTKRKPERVEIPGQPVDIMTGFSNEAVLEALGGTPQPLIDAIKVGSVRGVVGIVGCNNPKLTHDYCHTNLAKELIKRDILVVVTGCATVAMGKAGLLTPAGAEQAGQGLASVCKALGIPPVLHVGSCVDNARILHLCAILANALGVDMSDLPVAASAPEWYSEKAAAIGLYAVSCGIYTHLGLPPHITGSKTVTNLALNGLEDVIGASFAVEPDPFKAAELIDKRISTKRTALGLTP